MRFNSEPLMDELALMNIYVADTIITRPTAVGFPEGIKVTVLMFLMTVVHFSP